MDFSIRPFLLCCFCLLLHEKESHHTCTCKHPDRVCLEKVEHNKRYKENGGRNVVFAKAKVTEIFFVHKKQGCCQNQSRKHRA